MQPTKIKDLGVVLLFGSVFREDHLRILNFSFLTQKKGVVERKAENEGKESIIQSIYKIHSLSSNILKSILQEFASA